MSTKSKYTDDKPADEGRRKAILTGALALTALAVKAAPSSSSTQSKRKPIMPPGAKNLQHFLGACIACHLCISRCPSQVIRPAFTEYGLAGFMMPLMDYKQSFCTYTCNTCSTVCPTNALGKISMEDKNALQIGRVTLNVEHCVVYRYETDCSSCAEHCPTQAVHMIPYKDELRIPEIFPNTCIGCGACQYICPVSPVTAIYVNGVTPQVLRPWEEMEDELPENEEI
ncbi:MAG: 4Fe-4S dicluster domain-containing protein [Prevotellaceae bacterium]|jgi:ferredoxin|nr:4Fe-4S dicluster domain-containing protein [Prevotellaceae bacterium]